MATGAIVNRSQITDPAGYCVAAVARYGSDGDEPTVRELLVSGSSGSQGYGSLAWFPDDPTDGVYDTGLLAYHLKFPAGGGSTSPVQLQVANASPSTVTFGGRGYGTFGSVVVDAVVRINATARWDSLTVDFYKNGSVVDSYTLTASLVADTIGSDTETAQAVLTVTPASTDYDSVDISARVELVYPEDEDPDRNDLELRVYAFTSSCNG